MADRNIKGITVEIGGDTTGLDKALKDTETNSKKAASELRSINKALEDAPQNAVLWQQKQVVLNKALEESKKKLEILQTSQKSLSQKLADGDIDKAQYDKFREKLEKSRKNLDELNKSQADMKRQFDSGEIDKNAYEKFQEKIKKAEKAVKDLENAERSMEEKVKAGDISEDQYRAFQRELERSKSEVSKLETQVESVNQEVENLGRVSDDAADEVKQLGVDIASTGDKMEEIGGKIEGVGRKLLPVTAGITGIGTIAVKTAADFDSSMSKVSATSGAAGEDLETLRSKAREMGAQTKFSASEAGDAMNYMAMAGWKTNEMLSGIEGIMDLAAASGEDLATTSDIVTDALTAFGMTAADSGHFADILAAASSNANTNVSMMGETFKYAAPVMGAMGYSAEDAAIAIGLMANAGIKSSQAGTSLRGILSNLATPSDTVAAAMDKLGISLDDGAGNMISFRELMVQLREGFGELKLSAEEYEKRESALNYQYENGLINQKQYAKGMQELAEDTFGAEGAIKAQAAANLAGKESLSGLLAIVNASDADFEKLANAVDNCDGASKQMAETMQDNLGGQLTVLKSQLEELSISGGEILMPAIRDIVGEIQNVVDWLNKLDPETKETIVKTGLIAAAISPLLIVLGKVTSGIGSIIKVAAKVPGGINKIGGVIAKLGSSTAGATAIVMAFAVALGGLAQEGFNILYESTHKVVAETNEYCEKTRKQIENLDHLHQSGLEAASAASIQADESHALLNELKLLADASGNVKTKDEERAKYILNELKEATGVEYEYVDGQIQKYDELCRNIDKAIEKRKAERQLEIFGEEAAEAEKTAYEKKDEYFEAQKNYEASKKADTERWEKERQSGKVSAIFDSSQGESEETKAYKRQMDMAYEAYSKATGTLSAQAEAEKAYAEEHAELVESILYSDLSSYEKDLENYNQTSEQKEESFKTLMQRNLSNLKLANAANSREMQNAAVTSMAEMMEICGNGGFQSAVSFDAEFLSEMQKAFDQGVDFSPFFIAASEAGVDLGQILGGNMLQRFRECISQASSLANQQLYANNNLIQKTINSQSDANLYGKGYIKGDYGTPKMATGGILNYGKAIVAEAGPELLQLTNQGVQVTPLTQTARNHALSSVSSGDTYNQHITVNVQKISSDYDVRRIAQQMADELKRTRRGGGR